MTPRDDFRAVRALTGMDGAHFARLLGYSSQWTYMIEKGDRNPPKDLHDRVANELERIARDIRALKQDSC